ncbi:shikimate o-hydroxycinnamoyltransferase [Phtheirospermum japonicum]|uniref:Shikimate o-hydroxycinnamoyltransferase n=1 Tax=Phtheirospermum japonicum TaxID=374723 RepID=A0A830C3L8_9LAMI|nr:shikimate o-hydroxycinnamoyltransferase [Phtheirospermum japonicum]
MDRTVLRARSPPSPMFIHTEYHPPPPMKITQQNNPNMKFSMLTQTHDQINALKAKCNNNSGKGGNKLTYSTYEVLAGHVWRCVSIARGLPDDQETNLHIAVDGRSRMKLPSLPKGYFGNVVFLAAPVSTCGELRSNPLSFAAGKIHDTLTRMNDEYLRSALDYLETCDASAIMLGPHTYKCPNHGIINWVMLPFYEADFGWGKPIFVGPGSPTSEGKCYVLQSPKNDGGLVYAISLPKEQMELLEELLCDI